MPVWVKLYGVSNNMAHVKGISFIANRFGSLLLIDSISTKQRRLDFARVCVEIDAARGVCREGKFYKPMAKHTLLSLNMNVRLCIA